MFICQYILLDSFSDWNYVQLLLSALLILLQLANVIVSHIRTTVPLPPDS